MNRLKRLVKYAVSLFFPGQADAIPGAYPDGHYYSPVPSRRDLIERCSTDSVWDGVLPDIDLNEAEQLRLLDEFASYYDDLPFSATPTDKCRFYYENTMFGYTDAIILYCFLRKYRPAKIVEVGSGFSSAVMLDLFDREYDLFPEITLVEPYPDRLNALLRPDDLLRIDLLETRVQDVPDTQFSSLCDGDLLFIDSSHVVKCGSDLQYLMFEVIPQLKHGVFVHFHDVFYPFEYPEEWLMSGRYWNENYFLRAFLTCNTEWRIVLFNSFLNVKCRDRIEAQMPLCMRGGGGSLYLRRGHAG